MASQQDVYVPRYLHERPRGNFEYVKLLGFAAGIMVSVNVLLAGVADAAIGIEDNAPSINPALSQRVGNTLQGMMSGDFNVTCDDLSSTKIVDPDGRERVGRLAGYVSTYVLPFVENRISGSRIHLDHAICNDIDAIGYDPKTNIAPDLSYPQLHGLIVGAHEKVHVEGIHNEATTQCIALQRTAGSLALRGYDMVGNQSIRDAILSDYGQMLSKYRSDECRVDGALDLTPSEDAPSDAWLPVR